MEAGTRYGRLVLVEYVKIKHKKWGWRCQCDCGEQKVVARYDLVIGRIQSCGCYRNQKSAERCKAKQTHGHSASGKTTKEYQAHQAMKHRCYNPNVAAYINYGGRGIAVCDRWLHGELGKSGFECFLEDMGVAPPKFCLDRIDVNGMYEPKNCRWVSQTDSNRNKRNIKITQLQVQKLRNGELSVVKTAEDTGMTVDSVKQILRNRRWKSQEL